MKVLYTIAMRDALMLFVTKLTAIFDEGEGGEGGADGSNETNTPKAGDRASSYSFDDSGGCT